MKKTLLLITLILVLQNTKSQTTISSVNIGTQIWTNTNLDVITYSDGTPIPEVNDQATWNTSTTGAWCYYNNDSANGTTYGKLYNWYAVMGIYDEASKIDTSKRKKLAPIGYHVPSDAEWTTLTTFLGGENIAGDKMKEPGQVHWLPNSEADNSSGFTALPGGVRFDDTNTKFTDLNKQGMWWSTTEMIDPNADYSWIKYLTNTSTYSLRGGETKGSGLSVRCLNDNLLSNVKFLDNSIKIYPNPATRIINIKTESNLINQPYSIVNALGKILQKGILNETNTPINVEQLSKGIYFVNLANIKVIKFIKQ